MHRRDSPTIDRRALLALLGTTCTVALAGCSDSGDDTDSDDTPTATQSSGVANVYRTATAQSGQQRDPNALSAKSTVSYQEQPKDDQRCSGCRFYIHDKNGDGVGACAIVEGTVEPDAWCVSYAVHENSAEDKTDSQTVEAVDVPANARCMVCDMKVANFPEWNAQTVHTDGTREFFCSTGCATTYYAVPAEFAETDADIAGLWVRDVSSTDLINGTNAYYALETDSDRLDDPMRLNPAAFVTREDAVAYVDEVDYLTEDDVVQLSAFGRKTASEYRGRFLG